MSRKINWDALGIVTSIACAIHCAFLPLVLASLPVLGVKILDNTGFEYFMIALAFAIGSWALWHGYRNHHRRRLPWMLFLSGMLLLLAKQVWHAYELWFLPFAVLFILSAHWVNYRASRPNGRNQPGTATSPENAPHPEILASPGNARRPGIPANPGNSAAANPATLIIPETAIFPISKTS